jgi:pyridinium-3,5-bisthiocarboxylic acid mononucleotide nickel chelatase
MGRTLYLDCFSGISGDMLMGALLDLGAPLGAVAAELAKLPVGGYRLEAERRSVSGIVGTSFRVPLEEAPHDHGHPHGDAHPEGHGHADGHDRAHAHEDEHAHGRTYAEIDAMLATAPLDPVVQRTARAVFREIAEAEAAVHGQPVATVHFHEVGAVDSIVDIVGCAIALHALDIDRVAVSPLSDGSGAIRSRHGMIPVPVPAVAKMLEGTSIPYRTHTADTELVTPTGMGLAKVLAASFGPMPALRVEKVGYGFGTRDIGRLNALRAVLGTPADAPVAAEAPFGLPGATDRIVVLECQIDDSTPETLGYAAERLLAEGALDVAWLPAFMKKGRPAVLATVVCRPEDELRLVGLLFAETGTIGVRRRVSERHAMARSLDALSTEHGPVRVKRLAWGEVRKSTLEYEDVKRYAAAAKLPLQEAVRRLSARLDADGGEAARP